MEVVAIKGYLYPLVLLFKKFIINLDTFLWLVQAVLIVKYAKHVHELDEG